MNLVTNQISRQKQYRRGMHKPYTHKKERKRKQIIHPSQFPGIGITKYCNTMEHYTLMKRINLKSITEVFVCFSILILISCLIGKTTSLNICGQPHSPYILCDRCLLK